MKLLLLIAALAGVLPAGAGAGEPVSPWSLPPEGSCAPQGGLAGWPVGEDAPPVAFEPGDRIDIEHAPVLRNYLPPEIWEHRDRFFFEGMTLEVGPCFRDYSPPAFFGEATEKFRGRAKLLGNGGLAGHTAGLPFAPDAIDPADARAGQRWAWNVQARYRAGGFRGRFRISDLIGRVGVAEPFEGEIFQNQLAHRADRAKDGYRVPDTGTRAWIAGGRFFTPFRAREFAWLQYRDVENAQDPGLSDDLHLYLPTLRKVRRAPAHGVEGLFMPGFAVGVEVVASSAAVGIGNVGGLGDVGAGGVPNSIEPKRSGFEMLEMRPLLYEYQVLGVQDLLAPLNSTSPAYPEEELRSFGPHGLSWASDRWDLRRALVLEGTRREATDTPGELAKLRLWVDLQTLYPLYYVSYDRRGEQIDVGYFAGRWSGDRDDYPEWPGAPDRKARVIDPVGAGFANLRLRGSWRRESWNVVSTPQTDKQTRRSLSIRSLQKGR
ncbi:MAG: DUF1329 domain-containing protein [Deltaproteobacteria bacterium]|nr:DUF1329 domain-containing protein [Deltaproteobacteria bacterium]